MVVTQCLFYYTKVIKILLERKFIQFYLSITREAKYFLLPKKKNTQLYRKFVGGNK